MTLRHLKIFISVYETGSTTVTARNLHIAQPSISLAISEMEKYYDIRLFERMSRHLYVTDTGRKMYEYAKHIVTLFDTMEQTMFNADSSSSINIGATITIGTTIIPGLLAKIKKDSPDLSIKTTINKITVLETMLHSNELDLALVENPPEDKNLILVPFSHDHLTIICSPNDENAEKKDLDPHVLESKPLLLRDKGSAGRVIVDSLMLINNLNPVSTMESVSPQAIISAVSMGLGYSILPYPLVCDALGDNRISSFTIRNIEMNRIFSIVYHKNKYLTKAAELFISELMSFTNGK